MNKTLAAIGDPAPKIKEKAYPTNVPIQIPNKDDVPTLLVFLNYQTAMQIETVVTSVRYVVPDPQKLKIVNVINLKNVSRMMQGMAKKIIKAAYDSAAATIPEGFDPAEQLMLLPDWKGKVLRAYGVDDVNEHLSLILIDQEGKISERYQGQEPEKESVKMVLALLR